MTLLRWLFAAALLLACAIAGIVLYQQNSDAAATLSLFGWRSPEIAYFWWVVGSLVTGVIVGVALTAPAIVGSKLRERSLRRRLDALDRVASARPAEADLAR